MPILLAMNTRLAQMIPALLVVIAVACATQPTSNLTPTSSPPPLLPAATPQNADLETLVASALAGGDCIDDADALRAGGTARVLGFRAKAPSTLGTFLRSFRWAHVRQLDRVSRQLLARAWAAGAGPGDAPFTIDLDSTICETYGLAKEGAHHHGYAGARGYHPLLAIAAGTGDVLMARLREGRAITARGAAHFLRETSVGYHPAWHSPPGYYQRKRICA